MLEEPADNHCELSGLNEWHAVNRKIAQDIKDTDAKFKQAELDLRRTLGHYADA